MKVNLILEIEDPNKDICIDLTGSSNVTLTGMGPIPKHPENEIEVKDFPVIPSNAPLIPGPSHQVPIEPYEFANNSNPPEVRGFAIIKQPNGDGMLEPRVFNSTYLENEVSNIQKGYIATDPWYTTPIWIFNDSYGASVGLVAKDLARYARVMHGSEFF